jgi:hypothetical protein
MLLLFTISLSAQETRRFYVKKASVSSKKADGTHWNLRHTAPDFKIVISVFQGQSWKAVFTSPVIKGKYVSPQPMNTQVDTCTGEELQIEIVNQDPKSKEAIGSQVLKISEETWGKLIETEVQVGQATTLAYFCSRYKTLDLTPEQKRQVQAVESQLSTAERYMSSAYTASSAYGHVEKAEKALAALKDISDHPTVVDAEQKLNKITSGLLEFKVQDIVRKIESAKRLYESARQQSDGEARKHLEVLQKLVQDLPQYNNIEAGKKIFHRSDQFIKIYTFTRKIAVICSMSEASGEGDNIFANSLAQVDLYLFFIHRCF